MKNKIYKLSVTEEDVLGVIAEMGHKYPDDGVISSDNIASFLEVKKYEVEKYIRNLIKKGSIEYSSIFRGNKDYWLEPIYHGYRIKK